MIRPFIIEIFDVYELEGTVAEKKKSTFRDRNNVVIVGKKWW